MPETAAEQRTRYPLAAYNFQVTVGDAAMSFTEVSGLSREYRTLTYRHGLSYWEGESIAKFRVDRYAQVTLKKGIVPGVAPLYDWLEGNEEKPVSVSLRDEKGNPVVTWRIRKALLVKLDAPSLQASGGEVAVETLTLMAAGISVERA